MYHYNNFQKNQKAVALGFEEKTDHAPKILGSGNGIIAEKIIEIARQNNIPIHKNADLVEVLSVLEINEHIPFEVYSVVAEILNYVYEQEEKKKQNRLKT
jgi:flagellar biosynthesis protein